MGAHRYRISPWVFNSTCISRVSTANESDVKLNTRRDIPYQQATMYHYFCLLNKHSDDDINDDCFSEDFQLLYVDFLNIVENNPTAK